MGIAPSALEQYLLELINRGRADPNAEAVRYGADLNANLAPGTIDATAKQPLAFSIHLNNAADVHTASMLRDNYFSHTGSDGSNPSQRSLAANWTPEPGFFPFIGENISFRASTVSTNGSVMATIDSHHEGLYLSAGHRENLMRDGFSEIGLGQQVGSFTVQGFTYPYTSILTEKFADGGRAFLTGVAINDTDNDDFYDVGEGLAGVIVTATGTNGTFSTTTWDSGGYSLQLAPGTYSVSMSGNGVNKSANIVITTDNVKLDAEAGGGASIPVTTPDAASLAVANQMGLAFLGRGIDSTLNTATANLLNGSQPSKALLDTWFQYGVSDGVFSATDNLATVVNKVFNNIFGRDALPFEQAAWSSLTLGEGGLSTGELIWGIWSGYLGANNVPDAYKIPAQTRLIVTEAYTNALAANPAADVAVATLGSAAATAARDYLSGVVDIATAAPKASGAAAAVSTLTSSALVAATDLAFSSMELDSPHLSAAAADTLLDEGGDVQLIGANSALDAYGGFEMV